MVSVISDIGNGRSINQDFTGYFEENEIRFYAIADGMGGHNAGEIASEIAIKTTIEVIRSNLNTEDLEQLMRNAISEANKKIYNLSNKDKALKGMGTTITTCLIKDSKAVIANVGDSSCIAINGYNIFKITRDHSLVQELIDSGDITEEEAQNHPNKNIITRALGTNASVEVDIFILNPCEVEKFILCTDGLTNKVKLSEILEIVYNNNEEESCKKLVQLSKYKGSSDNISVIVFEGVRKYDRDYTRE